MTRPEAMSERAFVRAVNGLVKKGLLATAGDGSGKADRAGHGDGAVLTITDAGLNAIGVTPEPEPESRRGVADCQGFRPAAQGVRSRAPAGARSSPDPAGDQARADHRDAVAPERRDAGRSHRRHRLAAPHHPSGADRPAPEGLQLDRSRDEDGRAVYRIVAGAETASSRGRAA